MRSVSRPSHDFDCDGNDGMVLLTPQSVMIESGVLRLGPCASLVHIRVILCFDEKSLWRHDQFIARGKQTVLS